MKIGVTGANGFIGSHLTRTIKLLNNFPIIPFERYFFSDEKKLDQFVNQCDIIFHLAGVNRHENSKVLFQTNIQLAEKLSDSIKKSKSKPYVIYASSTQENENNDYGKSKYLAGEIIKKCAKDNNLKFKKILIPNVYGPFSKPFYNTVVATFINQHFNDKKTKIENDKKLCLIYVDDLIDVLLGLLNSDDNRKNVLVPTNLTTSILVSDLDSLIENITTKYKKGEIINCQSKLERNLLNMIICQIDYESFFPFKLVSHKDSRGSFSEVIRAYGGGQVSFSTTEPGITRGNHFHTRKIERFCVIKGSASIKFRKVDEEKVFEFNVSGENPSVIDMPIWHTHLIENTGNDELVTLFWISEHYDESNGDTYFNNV